MFEDEINLADYWGVLAKRKRLIGSIVGVALIASIAVSLLLPNAYDARASVLLPQRENTSVLPFLSQMPADLGGFASMFLGQNSATETWREILQSRTVFDAVIKQFDLTRLYGKETLDETRKVLEKKVDIEKSKTGVTIFITVEDKDPKRAADMANAFVAELDRVNKQNVMSSGFNQQIFIEDRLRETGLKLAKDEEALKRFQESKGAMKIDSQAAAIIGNIARTKAELMAKEVELRTMMSYAEPSNPQAGLLRAEVEELKKELGNLENGRREPQARNGDIFIPTADMPKLSEEYERLLREFKLQEALYGLLKSQYELAKMQGSKDSPTVVVLDRAVASTVKAKPRRVLIVTLSSLAAVLLSVFVVFILEYIDGISSMPGKRI